MPPDLVWSDQFQKPEIQLSLRGIGWKNLMNKCLIQAETFKGGENMSETTLNFDPTVLMNIRHEMVKDSSKAFRTPRGQIQSDALKLLREEYRERLAKHKEGKLVETEIGKLVQALENGRAAIRKRTEGGGERAKAPRWSRCQGKVVKGLGHGAGEWKVGERVGGMPPGPFGCRRVSAGSGGDVPEGRSEGESCRKGSVMEEEDEGEMGLPEEEERGGDDVGMKMFMESDVKLGRKEAGFEGRKEVKVRGGGVQSGMNEASEGRALRKWKNEVSWKNRKAEGKLYGKKIDEFLSRLAGKKRKDERGSGTRRKVGEWEKREKGEKRDEELRKLMEEVKSSEREAQRKLQRVAVGVGVGGEARVGTESKFLVRMEERRRERAKRRKELEERKARLEAERGKLEREREEEEKRRRLEEVQERRRAEKASREEQKRERERLRAKMAVAVAHYSVHLVRGYGLRPWVRLVRMRRSLEEAARGFFERRLKERVLGRWGAAARAQGALRMRRAVGFYEEGLKRKCFATWVGWQRRRAKQDQVAVDWYELKVVERGFRGWFEFTKAERSEGALKRDLAVTHYQRKLKVKYMQRLLEYPAVRREERARENRKWKWRQKVKEILPDYEPIDICEGL